MAALMAPAVPSPRPIVLFWTNRNKNFKTPPHRCLSHPPNPLFLCFLSCRTLSGAPSSPSRPRDWSPAAPAPSPSPRWRHSTTCSSCSSNCSSSSSTPRWPSLRYAAAAADVQRLRLRSGSTQSQRRGRKKCLPRSPVWLRV